MDEAVPSRGLSVASLVVATVSDPVRAPNVAVNHALIADSLSAGVAASIGAARDAVATRVACDGFECATPVGLSRDLAPAFLRYQQRSLVVWLMR